LTVNNGKAQTLDLGIRERVEHVNRFRLMALLR
jgi:hypothetical protein